MADLECELEPAKVTSLAVTSGDADGQMDGDDLDKIAKEIPIQEGPLDASLLMDLGFIKRTLDNLVNPSETQAVLDMAVEYIKQDTGEMLRIHSENFKGLEAKLTVLEADKGKVKEKVSTCQDRVKLLKDTVTENQTKLKCFSQESNPVTDSQCS